MSVVCFGDIVISATDPNFGKPADQVTGDPLAYAIQDFTLKGPAGGGVVGTWTLTIDTNYGINTIETSKPNHGSVAGDTSMPVFCDGGGVFMGGFSPCPGSIPFFMSDFLIQQGSNYYGIVMSTGHVDYTLGSSDSYVAGNVYDASGFLSSLHGAIPSGPVILAPNGTKVDSGSLTVALNTAPGGLTCYGAPHGTGASATNCAEYRVTDTFTVAAASNFFNPNASFTIYDSSADCFNATLMYQNAVPEPGGLAWLVPGLLLLGAFLRRRARAAN